MNDDKWESLKDRVERKFEISERGKDELEDGGYIEWIIFSSPSGKIKLARTSKPRVVGETATYSKRIGANIAVKKIVDPDAIVNFLKIYQWDSSRNDWRELENISAFTKME